MPANKIYEVNCTNFIKFMQYTSCFRFWGLVAGCWMLVARCQVGYRKPGAERRKPGKQNGNPVSAWFNVQVKFELQNRWS